MNNSVILVKMLPIILIIKKYINSFIWFELNYLSNNQIYVDYLI